jgi:mono/diheme cytochrome c family protein
MSRPRPRALLWAGAAALALVAALFGASEWRIRRPHACAAWQSPRGASAERGRELAQGVALCAFCHGGDLAGRVAVDDPWIGRLYAPNLTPSGGRIRSDAEIEWAVRHGVRRDGRSLWLMPSEHLRALSDRQVADLIAYLRQLPPAGSPTPARRMGPLTRVVLLAGLAPELLAAERVGCGGTASDEEAGASSRGAALVEIGSCRVCHRADLRGGLHPLSLPDEPPPPDLSRFGQLADWSEQDFRRAMHSGRTPGGRVLDARYMPWPHYAALDEAELGAIWRYLRSIPAGPRAR